MSGWQLLAEFNFFFFTPVYQKRGPCWRRSKTPLYGRWPWDQWRSEPSCSESASDSQSHASVILTQICNAVSIKVPVASRLFDWMKRGQFSVTKDGRLWSHSLINTAQKHSVKSVPVFRHTRDSRNIRFVLLIWRKNPDLKMFVKTQLWLWIAFASCC